MSWEWVLLAAISFLLAAFLTGMPIYACFLIVNISGLLYLIGTNGFGLFANSIYQSMMSETFTTIVLFVLMGEILFRSGALDVIFNSLDTLLKRVKGRLYYFVALLGIIFGALSGSALAVTAMLSRSTLPMMIDRDYDARMSVGLIVSSASLAPIIPPSILVIVIGSLADVSIAKLLIAGALPGLLLGAMFLFYVKLTVLRAGNSLEESVPEEPSGKKGVVYSFLVLLPFSIVIFSVLGLIMLGVATPSESAATGVLGALTVAAIYRKLNFSVLAEAMTSTLKLSAMIIIIVVSSNLFSQLLSFSGASRGLITFITSMDFGYWAMLIALLGIAFFACMFLDQYAFMMVSIPIYLPIIQHYGYDAVWFWTLYLINLAVGSITPPFGYNLFAVKGAYHEISMKEIYLSVVPFVICYLLAVMLIMMFPAISTFLPNLV